MQPLYVARAFESLNRLISARAGIDKKYCTNSANAHEMSITAEISWLRINL